MFRFYKKMCRFLVNCFEFFDSAHRFVLLWSQIRPNWTEKSSNNPVGDQNCLKNDCVKTVFFNSVFEIFVLKVCVLKKFKKWLCMLKMSIFEKHTKPGYLLFLHHFMNILALRLWGPMDTQNKHTSAKQICKN